MPVCNFALALSLSPLSIPIVNQLLLWSSICATILVVFFRAGKGIYEGVFQKAANEQQGSVGQWFVRSVLSVACVALMPLFCNLIIEFGCKAFGDISGLVNEGLKAAGNTDIGTQIQFHWNENGSTSLIDTVLAGLDIDKQGAYLIGTLAVLAVGVIVLTVCYNIFKRQLIVLVVSIASSWVAIKTASDSADDVIDLLVSLFGLMLIQIVQYVFLAVALNFFASFGGASALISADFTDQETLTTCIFFFALFGCAKAVPSVLERYAFSVGRGGSGSMIVGAAVRSGIAMPGKIAGNTVNILSKVKK